MKRILLIISVLALPLMAHGQIVTNDLETELGARIGVSADKKLAKGLHLELSGEARMTDNFSQLGRFDAGIGLNYKINDIFKVGAGYTLIDKMSSSGTWKLRHRVYLDAKATLHSGPWSFSLKERLQLTHKDVNAIKHQTTPNSLTLKSRLKAQYKIDSHWSPYGYVEVRNVFNDPACSATWSTVSQAYGDYEFLGYNHAYLNRVRGSIGVDWKIDKHNSFDFYILTDYCKDKETDTADNGTRLKSLTWQQTLYGAACIGYKFSF